MKSNLIKTVMGVSIIAGILTGCGSKEEEVVYPHHSKIYLPDKYNQAIRYDMTPEQLIKLSTPFYNELSSVDTLHEEVLSMKKNAKEFERKEAERKRLEEIRKQKLAQLEKEKQKERELKQTQISRGNETSQSNWMTFKGTYYGADCAGCSGRTALGYDVKNTIYANGLRVIAVDPRIIPLGSIVEVQAPYGTFKAIAGDTGGAIKGYKVDILVGSEHEATQIGTHPVQIRILKQPIKK